MSAPAEPLNVQVARALGCTPVSGGSEYNEWWMCDCDDLAHIDPEYRRIRRSTGNGDPVLAPYGDNTPEGWAVTGPVAPKGIEIALHEDGSVGIDAWAYAVDRVVPHVSGDSIPEAIARLVVHLHAEQSLHAGRS